MSKTIVILGASFAGLSIAHKLLKKTLSTTDKYRVVLVGPNTHHYWNLATVRAVVPGLMPDEKIFADIRPGFKQYPTSKFTFIHGRATSVNSSKKFVQISKVGNNEEIIQDYDILVICTGSRYDGEVPWKSSLDGYEATKDKLHAIQDKVKNAKSIVVGGGGATGCEVSGELGFEYGSQKEITLITAGDRLISPTMVPSASTFALQELTKLRVKVLLSTKIVSSKKVGSKYELTLSDGTTKTVDLYLPTGGVTPNTEFLPKEWLNNRGEIIMEDSLKVKGVEGVWAAGDVIDLEPSQLAFATEQSTHLAKNLDAVINGRQPTPYKKNGEMIAVTLGRNKATGRYGNWKLPSVMLWWIKGRTLFTDKQPGVVSGADA